ncbi:unnamed protein product [Clonostachys chloroleuca]|uniref:Phenylacetyl-CoA ligase n=1 Tax=Clonostachys chloroleuca TaxID=1926264 RepID=A0AA35LXM0_9HYPO|nr:unnamed protein product [Clonostachys chloroleuca]
MVFRPPPWVPPLPEIPDSITVAEFISNDKYGRHPIKTSRRPFTCGMTGRSYTIEEVNERVNSLAKSLHAILKFDVEGGTEWDRVVAIYSLNTIDYIPATHAVHRLSGIVTPASLTHSAKELEHQLRSSGAKALFTCIPFLQNAIKACEAVGIPQEHIFILPVPGMAERVPFKSIEDLILEGRKLPPLLLSAWIEGQGARQVAYLCYSSGTSGHPKAVMVSHRNIIANTMQTTLFDSPGRRQSGVRTQVSVGVLPFSHIYGLTVICHVAMYRGDEIIVLPKYEFQSFLSSVQKFKVEQLHIVPPILISMISNPDNCKKYDLSSVRLVFSGAAPLGSETMAKVSQLYPSWKLGQGYGLTEASPSITSTSEHDIFPGSAGSIIPGTKVKILDTEGNEVTEHEMRGELLVQSDSVTLGYLNNEQENAQTYVWHHDGRWLRTGDEVLVRKSPQGHEHVFIVDRIKELIKVKGHQVAPAELEAHLLDHHLVSDCAVIGIEDERAGQLPKAYVVKSVEVRKQSLADQDVIKAINSHVEDHKARHKWLKGGIQFIDSIPKSPSGKILRRLLKEQDKKGRISAKI